MASGIEIESSSQNLNHFIDRGGPTSSSSSSSSTSSSSSSSSLYQSSRNRNKIINTKQDISKLIGNTTKNNDYHFHNEDYHNRGPRITRVATQTSEVSRLSNLDDLVELFDSYSKLTPDQLEMQDELRIVIASTKFPRLLIKEISTNGRFLTPFILQPSVFHSNRVPSTIYFSSKISNESRSPVSLPKCLQRHLKWKFSAITPNSIRSCITFSKLDLIKTKNQIEHIGSWCRHMLTAEFMCLEEWQKVNHFPGSFNLGRKDKLWLRLKAAQSRFGSNGYDFHPKTFILPKDYEELKEFWSKSERKLFIIKPPASSRGNGIKVINDLSQIPESATESSESCKKSTMIVQQYISNPCLLQNGHKFDLRIYVLLTNLDPLRLYVYKEGLVRFASSKYSTEDDGIIDQYMHLTNYFINKNNRDYKVNNDCNSLHGSKWTLSSFWAHLEEHYKHVNTKQLWAQILDIIIKTVISCEASMSRFSRNNCKNDYTSYELFGFDIILDGNFKPWILEVNITPSLKCDSELDNDVKYRVIKDMFNLVGYNIPPNLTEDLDISELPICYDKRLYTEELTKHDKLKHQKFYKSSRCERNTQTNPDKTLNPSNEETQSITNNELETDQTRDSKNTKTDKSYEHILDDLTQNDIRVLMLTEDELARKGDFIRVFPSNGSSKYLKQFEKPRYYNQLVDAWEHKYRHKRQEGLLRLSRGAIFLE